ncbi:uromodulin-like [Xenopus laevis]|uniref:Uromodulin n=1 Tax=Xenopus laevis TaxID=8355 RepID=A0A8J1LRT2_XENLA|nr:uromodulin-like [Xenopus laevis]
MTSSVSSSSLTYVVDTTGSMLTYIQQLKLVNNWLVDYITAHFPCGERQYTMVEFNDPTIGPARITSSKEEFKTFFSSLTASGGGDCPELAMSGLKLALEISPPKSFILVFTDASAKDYTNSTLLNNIYSLIDTKQSRVVFLTTGLCSSLTDPGFTIYKYIASLSYGHVFQIAPSDLSKVFTYLDFTLSRPVDSLVKLLYKVNDGTNHCDNITVTADFTSLLVMIDGKITSTTVFRPDHNVLIPDEIVFENWGSLYQIENPAKGVWTICVNSSSPHVVQVDGLTVTNTSVTKYCSDCHTNAICQPYHDLYQCICKDGFIGDGFSCSDVDECAYSWLNNCTSAAHCENTCGSYNCRCPVGYTRGAGNTCVDIDECSRPDLNKCHPLAKCINTNGSYICQCPPGVTGNGFYCETDPCSRGVCRSDTECIPNGIYYYCSDPCVSHTVLDDCWRSSSNAQYVDTKCDNDKVGWYRFTGSGGIRMPEFCVPKDRCNTVAPMWLNGSHPIETDGIVSRTVCAHGQYDCCQWSSTVQIKACPGGYHVYKLNRTPTCSMAYCTDPRSINNDCLCASDEECRTVSGKCGCYCKDNVSVSALKDLTPSVSCGLQNMKTSFRKCEMRALNIDYLDIILDDGSCFSVLDDNVTNTFSVMSPLQEGSCGMTFSTNGTHAFYRESYDFFFVLPGKIIRDKLTTTSTCIFQLDMELSLQTALNPIISNTIINISRPGQFSARMAVYNSSDYKYPYNGSQIDLLTHTKIYIGVFLVGPDPSQYAMVLKNCYATPSSSKDDPTRYYIIQNRCPNPVDPTISVAQNGVSSQAQFSFEMFSMGKNPNQVYLHCEIYACVRNTNVCEPVSTNNCENSEGNG